MHALVIDDSGTTRRIIAAILAELGFDVDEAENGNRGLDRLHARRPPPALVIVDWNMPELDGLSFIKAVRADHGFDRIPLLMVTTEVEKHQVLKALAAGANEYVMKPFTKEMLVEKLAIVGLGAH